LLTGARSRSILNHTHVPFPRDRALAMINAIKKFRRVVDHSTANHGVIDGDAALRHYLLRRLKPDTSGH
jgi:hypothetical protein